MSSDLQSNLQNSRILWKKYWNADYLWKVEQINMNHNDKIRDMNHTRPWYKTEWNPMFHDQNTFKILSETQEALIPPESSKWQAACLFSTLVSSQNCWQGANCTCSHHVSPSCPAQSPFSISRTFCTSANSLAISESHHRRTSTMVSLLSCDAKTPLLNLEKHCN